MKRLVAFAPLAVLLVALFVVAAPAHDTPWSPAPLRSIAAAELAPLNARLEPAGDALDIRPAQVAADFGVSARLQGLDAARVAHVELETTFSPGLRPVLLWSVAGQVRHSFMPWFGRRASLRVADVAGWQGPLDWVGVAWVPLDVLAPADLPRRHARLYALRLQPPGRAAALRNLGVEWLSWRPWGGKSINTAGFEVGPESDLPRSLWLAVLVMALVWAATPGRGWSARRRLATGFALAWALMLAFGLRQQLWRAGRYHALAAAAEDGRGLSASWALAERIARLQAALPAGRERLLVHGVDDFERVYATYLLHDRDVGEVRNATALPPAWPDPTLLLALIGKGDWQFDPARGVLRFGAREFPAEAVWAGVDIHLYRLRNREAAP